MERFERFRFSVPAVPLSRGFFCVFSTISQERTVPVPVSVPGKTVPAVPVLLSVSGKTVPVSGSGFRFLSHPETFIPATEPRTPEGLQKGL